MQKAGTEHGFNRLIDNKQTTGKVRSARYEGSIEKYGFIMECTGGPAPRSLLTTQKYILSPNINLGFQSCLNIFTVL